MCLWGICSCQLCETTMADRGDQQRNSSVTYSSVHLSAWYGDSFTEGVNPLAPGRTVRWMPQGLVDDNHSTLVQVMTWCLMAPSHYLNQYWQSSMMAYFNFSKCPVMTWGFQWKHNSTCRHNIGKYHAIHMGHLYDENWYHWRSCLGRRPNWCR